MPHPGTGHRRHPLRRTAISHEVFPLSCGHRFCPQCQHEAGETWLERQRAKLLPADDYLITFTLPATLLALVYDHQREAYDLLIRLAWQTLAAFGLRDKALHGDLGATVVLHTHSRALDFHPHVHVVLPAGAIDPATRHWNRKPGKFLFPHKALAKDPRPSEISGKARGGGPGDGDVTRPRFTSRIGPFPPEGCARLKIRRF